MWLILEAGRNRRRENLLISDKVAITIPDKYIDTSFRDIVLIERRRPEEPP